MCMNSGSASSQDLVSPFYHPHSGSGVPPFYGILTGYALKEDPVNLVPKRMRKETPGPSPSSILAVLQVSTSNYCSKPTWQGGAWESTHPQGSTSRCHREQNRAGEQGVPTGRRHQQGGTAQLLWRSSETIKAPPEEHPAEIIARDLNTNEQNKGETNRPLIPQLMKL